MTIARSPQSDTLAITRNSGMTTASVVHNIVTNVARYATLAVLLTACQKSNDAKTQGDSIQGDALSQAIRAGEPQTEMVVPRSYLYKCENNFEFTANVTPDSVQLTLPDRQLTLPHVVSASGARYSNDTVTYWSKGDGALLETGKQSYSSCKIAQPGGS